MELNYHKNCSLYRTQHQVLTTSLSVKCSSCKLVSQIVSKSTISTLTMLLQFNQYLFHVCCSLTGICFLDAVEVGFYALISGFKTQLLTIVLQFSLGDSVLYLFYIFSTLLCLFLVVRHSKFGNFSPDFGSMWLWRKLMLVSESVVNICRPL